MNRNKSSQAELEFADIPGTSIRVCVSRWAPGRSEDGCGAERRGAIDRYDPCGTRRGITMFDTAPAYGFGRSEEIVGEAFAQDGRRNRVLIATKVGLNWHDGKCSVTPAPSASARKSRIVAPTAHRLHRPLPGALAGPDRADREHRRELDRLHVPAKSMRSASAIFAGPDGRFRAVAPLHTAQPPYNRSNAPLNGTSCRIVASIAS